MGGSKKKDKADSTGLTVQKKKKTIQIQTKKGKGRKVQRVICSDTKKQLYLLRNSKRRETKTHQRKKKIFRRAGFFCKLLLPTVSLKEAI